MHARLPHLDEVLQHAATLERDWPTISARIPAWHPRNEATPEQKAAREAAEAAAAAAAGAGSGGGSGDAKTFSQEAVNKIVEDRLARERQKYADFDDLKEKAKKFDEAQAASLSELEREKQAREAAEQRATSVTDTAHKALKRAELLTQATKAGATSPEDVVDLVLTRAGDKVTIGDDGQVTGAEDAVKDFLKDRPTYVGKPDPTPTPHGGDGGARPIVPAKELDQQLVEASKKGDWATVNRLNAQKLAGLAGAAQ